MREYPKIESLFDRDEATFRFIPGAYRLPEFGYLSSLSWRATEKIDGTNIRVEWDGERVTFGGRTDRAQTPTFLLTKLQDLFPVARFGDLPPLTLYGEGYGAKIQKGGGNYIADDCDFILFDVLVGEWWLQWDDICDVAGKLTINVVPVVSVDSLSWLTKLAATGFTSAWGHFNAEGLVAKPIVDLNTRAGKRIIVKIKEKDFAPPVSKEEQS